MNWRKVLGPSPDTNRNQDAIDILDKARSSFVYPYILESDANYHAYMLLLHAAEYLELQGRI